MKQLWTIFKFELKSYLANKIFIGVTLAVVILTAIVMFFPRVEEMVENIKGEEVTEEKEDDEKAVMLIAGAQGELVYEAFAAAFNDYEVKVTTDTLDDIKKQITSKEAECAFVIDDITQYTYYVNNKALADHNTVVASEVLQMVYRMSALMNSGLSAEEAEEVMTFNVEYETETLGVDQAQNFFYTYIMIFALYMVIVLYGQLVATNVASEKSSRAMEVLVTSAKPTSMMFGKVLASCTAGFLQLAVVFGFAFFSFNLNKSYWDEMGTISAFFDVPASLLVYMLVFFVLGFLIYAFMFAAISSTASKVEDINTSTMPITLMFVVAFLVVFYGFNNVDGMLMKVVSYIPFTSPMAMFTRIAMSEVAWYEITISIAILVGSVIGIGVLAAKIYRMGVLLYGTQPKLGEILKAVKKA
ncbi:MAG: ABC transporter permease [Lachnospiraceae bacterium]|nr:ABC transporter permease [Lachnospiraceae bacterium]